MFYLNTNLTISGHPASVSSTGQQVQQTSRPQSARPIAQEPTSEEGPTPRQEVEEVAREQTISLDMPSTETAVH